PAAAGTYRRGDASLAERGLRSAARPSPPLPGGPEAVQLPPPGGGGRAPPGAGRGSALSARAELAPGGTPGGRPHAGHGPCRPRRAPPPRPGFDSLISAASSPPAPPPPPAVRSRSDRPP